MKESTIILIFLILLALVPLAFLAGMHFAPTPEGPTPQIDTVWVRDTVKLTDSKPAGSVIATLPVVCPARPELASNANNLSWCVDTLHTSCRDSILSKPNNFDTVPVPKDPTDSVTVEIPIEQRTYEGENYRAVVQGFRPELVSIDIRLPKCPTYPAAPSKRKWWSVTVGPQVGYGFTPKGWQPYAGVGVTLGISF